MTNFSSAIYARKNFSDKYIWIVANYISVFFYVQSSFMLTRWNEARNSPYIVYNLIITSQVIKHTILHLFYQWQVNPYPCIILCAGPPPVHQLIRNDKTEKPPTVSVSSAPTFSSVLRPEDGHRGIESPHSQTGMYSPSFSNCLLNRGCQLLENLAPIR